MCTDLRALIYSNEKSTDTAVKGLFETCNIRCREPVNREATTVIDYFQPPVCPNPCITDGTFDRKRNKYSSESFRVVRKAKHLRFSK